MLLLSSFQPILQNIKNLTEKCAVNLLPNWSIKALPTGIDKNTASGLGWIDNLGYSALRCAGKIQHFAARRGDDSQVPGTCPEVVRYFVQRGVLERKIKDWR